MTTIQGTRSVQSSVSKEALKTLYESLESGTFFTLSRSDLLHLIHNAYRPEIGYLKTAYAAAYPGNLCTSTPSPSETLFGTRYPEVDRTLTGILALRWIHDENYDAFTNNQPVHEKLTRISFHELCRFYRTRTSNYTDHMALSTLVWMQLTNDIGKSSQLVDDLLPDLPTSEVISSNHDMVAHQVLKYAPQLVPSYTHLHRSQHELVQKLIKLSAVFNPGQLVQCESPPVVFETLTKMSLSPAELDMKFMELFLDLSGAKAHVDHDGAAVLTEQTWQGYWSVKGTCLSVVNRTLRPREAYERILSNKLKLLSEIGWTPAKVLDVRRSRSTFAKTRIFCMGRVADPYMAELYNDVYDHLPGNVQKDLERGLSMYGDVAGPAVQPTYMPAMLALAMAGPNPRQALTALLVYLAKVLFFTTEERAVLHDGTVLVERDVKSVLEELILSDAFKKQAGAVVGSLTPLPTIQVVKLEAR